MKTMIEFVDKNQKRRFGEYLKTVKAKHTPRLVINSSGKIYKITMHQLVRFFERDEKQEEI